MNRKLYELATIENIDLALNVFTKEELIDCILNFKTTYFRLKKENEKQYKIIENVRKYINKHCVNEKVSNEVGYKCYTFCDTQELEHIMQMLGDKE